jgi:hypothetical protein
MVCERRQKDQPTHTGQHHQHAQNSRQEGRPENEVADQEAIGPEKYQAVDFVRIDMKESKKLMAHPARLKNAASKERLLFTGLNM